MFCLYILNILINGINSIRYITLNSLIEICFSIFDIDFKLIIKYGKEQIKSGINHFVK